jgi:hypothetical protein
MEGISFFQMHVFDEEEDKMGYFCHQSLILYSHSASLHRTFSTYLINLVDTI